MELTKETFDFITDECEKHNEETNNDVGVEDVLFSFLWSVEVGRFWILNDWDEGKNNDPFWNEETNEHSAIHFIKQLCEELKKRGLKP